MKRKTKKRPKVTTWRGWGIVWDVPNVGNVLQAQLYRPDAAYLYGGKLVRVVAICTEVKR